ncbi:MAG: RDD family protein [Reichenbachiella sp.]
MKTLLPKLFPQFDESVYAGFGPRIGAFVLDFLIIMPFAIGLGFLQGMSQQVALVTLVFQALVFGFIYQIFFIKQYGATPGKHIAGIKVVKLDGTDVGWNEAILRAFVDILFMIFGLVITYMAIMSMSDEAYQALSFTTRGPKLQEWNPTLFTIQGFGPLIWALTEFIVLWTNTHRKDFRDFIGETLQIKRNYQKQILEIMKNRENESASEETEQ